MTLAIVLVLTVFQDPSPVTLVEKLRSDKPEERDEAVRKLKVLGRAAVPALERVAGDADVELSERARFVLNVIQISDVLSPALRRTSPGIEDRLAAGNADRWAREFVLACEAASVHPDLGAEDLDAMAIRALRAAMEQDLRDQVIHCIIAWSLVSAIPELIEIVKDKAAVSWQTVMNELGPLVTRRDAPALLERLRDSKQPAPGQIVEMIRNTGATDGIADLLKAAAGDDHEAQNAAIATLGVWGRVEAIPSILRGKDRAGGAYSVFAIEALGRLGDSAAIPHVLQLFKGGPAAGVQLTAPEAFARLNAEEAVPLLVDSIVGETTHRPVETMLAIQRISPSEARTLSERLLRSPKAWHRALAVDTVGRIGTRDRIPEIAGLIDDPDAGTRRAAMAALARLNARDQVKRIEESLLIPGDVPDAAEALAGLGARERVTLQHVTPLLQSAEPRTQQRGIELCRTLRLREAQVPIRVFLTSDQGLLRESAIRAVMEIDGKASMDSVRPLLRDPNGRVRNAAAEAFVRANVREGIQTLLKEARDRRLDHGSDEGPALGGRSCRLLNSLRRPEEWKRIQETKPPTPARGTRLEQIERVAATVGLKVDCPEGPEDAWLTGRHSEDPFEPPGSALDFLVSLLQGSRSLRSPPRFEFILVGGRLRILPYLDAIRFWEKWARE
jgi:HEAT repeat protein